MQVILYIIIPFLCKPFPFPAPAPVGAIDGVWRLCFCEGDFVQGINVDNHGYLGRYQSAQVGRDLLNTKYQFTGYAVFEESGLLLPSTVVPRSSWRTVNFTPLPACQVCTVVTDVWHALEVNILRICLPLWSTGYTFRFRWYVLPLAVIWSFRVFCCFRFSTQGSRARHSLWL